MRCHRPSDVRIGPGDTGPMNEQPPAAAIPPPSEADAARLQAEVVYSVTAGPESTADLDEVARAKARRDYAAASTPPDENWLHSAE